MELEQESVALLRQFARTYRAYAAAFEQRIGHPLPRWRVLHGLYINATTIGQKALAEQVDMDPGALTRQLKALQELGWVKRETSDQDNRITNVILSAQGRDVVEQGLPQRSAFLREVVEKVSGPTMRSFSKGLGQLEAGIAMAAERSRAATDVT
jgi:DNA-binding MarR family transcriptional regulator